MIALSLPRFISLVFEGKYLVCGENGVMQISGEDGLSPLAVIEVERSKCSEEVVHLRSCYNNKYLRMLSENDESIAAIAVEPEEDQSKWSCTLFRPRPRPLPLDDQIDSSSTISSNISDTDFEFLIMAAAAAAPLNSEETGGSSTTTTTTDSSFLKLTVRNTSEVGFRVINTLAVVQLPQYVILKGDNGKYLKDRTIATNVRELRFSGDEEDYLDASMFQVFRMADGSVRLNLIGASSGFLRLDDDSSLILTGSTSSDSHDLRSRFRPVKIGSSDTAVGLRILFNNLFCKRTDTNDAFGATSSKLESAVELEVEEAVGFRSVTELVYRLKDAKIYDFAPVTSVTKDVKNESESTQEGELTFTYTETKSQNWGSMTSWGVGVKVSMKARIPFIGKLEAQLGAEYDGEYEWGETHETETQVSTQLQLEVPPLTKTQVTMIVSRGTLEVPFAYVQRDTLYDGTIIVTHVDGGVFTGVNTYVSYETTEQRL